MRCKRNFRTLPGAVRKAYINLALAMSICGSAVVAGKILVSSIPTFLATELEILIGLLILLPLVFVIRKEYQRIDLRTHAILFSQALCGIFLYRILIFSGLGSTTAAAGGLISGASPVVVLALAAMVLREKLMLRQLLGILCGVAGVMIINLDTLFRTKEGPGSLKGNLLIAAAVLCEAFFSVLSKAACKPMTAMFRTAVIALYAFVLLLPFSIHDAIHYDFAGMDVKTVLCLLYYGIFVSFLSYVFWFRGVEKVSASNAAVFTGIVPVSSIVLSAVLLREPVKVSHLISLAGIVLGIWISCRSKRPGEERD